jgi:hypothetical protein
MLCPDPQRLLDRGDGEIEDLAYAVMKQLECEQNPLLLVQVEFTPNRRTAHDGLLLSEMVLSNLMIPTILATVDPYGRHTRTARRASRRCGDHFEPIVSLSQPVPDWSRPRPSLIVWDLLGNQSSFEQAAKSARDCVRTATPLQIENLKRALHNGLLEAKTAFLRHRLKGLMACLRITEGAFSLGWLSKNDLCDVRSALLNRNPSDRAMLERYFRELRKYRRYDRSFPRRNCSQVWVCDDEWETLGWDQLFYHLFRKRFGLAVRGFSSLQELEEALAKEPLQHVVTLFLDVHYSTGSKGGRDVDSRFIHRLRSDFPLIDTILFSTDLNDGLLVRNAYESGCRFFFKELEETARSPEVYATKFIEVTEESIRSTPLRAMSEIISPATESNLRDRYLDSAARAMRDWQANPKTTGGFSLVPLLEKQLLHYTDLMMPSTHREDPANTGSQVDIRQMRDDLWDWAKNICNFSREEMLVWHSWHDVFMLAWRCRNRMAHAGDIMLGCESLLPAVGLSLPIIVAMAALNRANSPDGYNDEWESAMRQNLASVAESALVSSQITSEQVAHLLEIARDKSLDPTKRLTPAQCRLFPLTTLMRDHPVFFEGLRAEMFPLLPADRSASFAIANCVAVVTLACILEHDSAPRMPDDPK